MDYDSRFLNYVAELAQVDIERCALLATEAYEHLAGRERYADAALIVMLACRRLRTHEARADLVGKFAALDAWEALRHLNFFIAWLADSQLGTAAPPRMRYDDSASRWIETEDNGNDGLLAACRIVFSDLEFWLEQQEGRDFGGMNLLFFLNRSRRRHGSARIHNPASFGLRCIAPASEEEQNTILGRVERGQLRIRSVELGTVGPQAHEE